MRSLELVAYWVCLSITAFVFVASLYLGSESLGLQGRLDWLLITKLVFGWAYLSWPIFYLIREMEHPAFWMYVAVLPTAVTTMGVEVLLSEG